MSWFSSSAPWSDGQPKWRWEAARTAGVTSLKMQSVGWAEVQAPWPRSATVMTVVSG